MAYIQCSQLLLLLFDAAKSVIGLTYVMTLEDVLERNMYTMLCVCSALLVFI